MPTRCKNAKVYIRKVKVESFDSGITGGLYPVPERVIKIIIVHTLVIIYPFLRCTLWKNNEFPSRMNDEIQITPLFLLNTKFHFREILLPPPATFAISKLSEKLFHIFLLLVKKFADVDTAIYETSFRNLYLHYDS